MNKSATAPAAGVKTAQYEARLLATVRRQGAVSRKQLGQMTRIRMPVITARVRDLVKRGILVESGSRPTGRGRRQILLSLNGRHGFVVGIEFDPERILAVVVDVCGRLVARSGAAMPAAKTPETILRALKGAVAAAIRKSGYPPGALQGIGVADPGVVDCRSGVTVFCSMMPEWQGVPVRDQLGARFGVPVWLDASTRAKTLCETLHGAGQGAQDLLYIDIGCGIGCGVLVDGRLYRGHMGLAGELGHTRVMEHGPVCNCGSTGCLETVSSYPAILRQVRKALCDGAQSIIPQLAGQADAALDMLHVLEAARQGDKLAMGILERAWHYLGTAIANAANLFNPEAIVLGLNRAAAGDVLVAPIQRIVDRHAVRLSGKALAIRAAGIGEEAGAWGAALLMLNTLYDGAAGATAIVPHTQTSHTTQGA